MDKACWWVRPKYASRIVKNFCFFVFPYAEARLALAYVVSAPDWVHTQRKSRVVHDRKRNSRHCLVCEVITHVRSRVKRVAAPARNQKQKNVVIKSDLDHPRFENECDVLKQFQHRKPFLRSLVDEIKEPLNSHDYRAEVP
jgi:hypothetical protein